MQLFSGPDRELRAIYWVLVNGSMALTAYFGWTLAEGVLPLQIVLALLFAAISRAVGRMFLTAAQYRAQGLYTDWVRCLAIGCLFAAANIVTDYGSAAAIRDANTVRSVNDNNAAKDVRNEVLRLEKRIAEIRGQTSWKTTYLAPAAYDSLIRAAELIRDNESKRGGCGRICEAKTIELETLNSNKANAMHRLALKAEMVQLERELVEAKAKAGEVKFESSAALAQVKSVIAWVGFSKDATETKVFWGNNAIMLWGAILTTLGIIYLATEIGSHTPQTATQAAPTGPRYLASQYTSDAPVSHPSPLHAVDAPAARSERMEVYHSTTSTEQKESDMRERFERLRQGLAGVSAGQRDRLGMEQT